MIKLWDTDEQFDDQRTSILSAIARVGNTGQYFNHPEIDRFEDTVKEAYGFEQVVSCNSGTTALTLALQNLTKPVQSITEENNWIIVPAMTYIATPNAIANAGFNVQSIDIDEHWLMDFSLLAETLETFNRIICAVVFVDLYGQTGNLPMYYHLCKNYDIPLIVDAAQSWGLKGNGWDPADYADVITFSMNPLKNWGAMGSAGALGSKYQNLSHQRAQSHQGKLGNDIVTKGGNYRLDAIQAAVLNAKYPLVDKRIARKRKISEYYKDRLTNLVDMPEWGDWATHQHYVFPFATKRADAVRQQLTEDNIQFGSHYHQGINEHTPYYDYTYTTKTRFLKNRIITIPNHAHLSDSDVERVVTSVISAL